MKEYKNPEIYVLELVSGDVLMTSGDPPEIDPMMDPNGTPSVSLF